MGTRRIRLAIVGGRRGAAYQLSMRVFAERVELTAFCDHSEAAGAQWQAAYPGIRRFDSYDDLLDADVCDAVTWSALIPLSVESVARGSVPVAIPSFARRASPVEGLAG